jgi:hypothetical protein
VRFALDPGFKVVDIKQTAAAMGNVCTSALLDKKRKAGCAP